MAPGVEVRAHVGRPAAANAQGRAAAPHGRSSARQLAAAWRRRRPDVVHAHYWMSGMAVLACRPRGGRADCADLPRLGSVKRRHQGARRHQPGRADRGWSARWRRDVRPDRRHLHATRSSNSPGSGVRRGAGSRWCPAGWTPAASPRAARPCPAAARPRLVTGAAGSAQGRRRHHRRARRGARSRSWWWPAGPPADRLDDDPEARLAARLAEQAGAADRVRFLGGLPRGEVPRCCARRTWSSACRGTNRSAWCRWRRWPVAGRWSPVRWAG